MSIIIPNYNRAGLLRQALDSVLKQTYPNWEVVVVDDGSTDASMELLAGYADRDARIRYSPRRSPVKGASVCRNEGFAASGGDFVIFLDSDDLLAPFCLKRRMKTVSEYPDHDFWVFGTLLFKQFPGDNKVLLNVETEEDPLERFLKMDVMWLATGPLWRRKAIGSLGGWDEKLKSGQDWDLSVRALIHGLKFRYFGNVDNYLREGTDLERISNRNSSREHLLLRLYLFRKIYRVLQDAGKADEKNLGLLYSLMVLLSVFFLRKNMRRPSMTAFRTSLTVLPGSRKLKLINSLFYAFAFTGLFKRYCTDKLYSRNRTAASPTFKKVVYHE